jgi:hypothetical protein
MAQVFDGYASSYWDVINGIAAFTGERFEDYIEIRVNLLDADRRALGKESPKAILDFGGGIGATE